ncbi:MAG: hypothetical protein AAF363_21600 [Bacteroidota bacterium]
MDNTINLEHFRNLISLAVSDGKIEETERVTLSKIAYEKGIPMDRMQVMLNGAAQYVPLIPQNQVDREKQLEEMVMMAMVDGEFAKAEKDLIYMVGGKLNFSEKEIEAIIENSIVNK